MPKPNPHEVTQLLLAWSEGDKAAMDQLIPLVYGELRRLAKQHMRRERAGHTLQTTALIHEAYLRLIDASKSRLENQVVAEELARKDGETDEQKTARVDAWIANRVPDIRFLLDHLLNDTAWDSEAELDPARIGIVGHSFGGWTALAATEVERRIRAVVALAPGGSSQPKPGIIPGKLTFNWGRNVPTMYLVAENMDHFSIDLFIDGRLDSPTRLM